jgi:hypothetical protein
MQGKSSGAQLRFANSDSLFGSNVCALSSKCAQHHIPSCGRRWRRLRRHPAGLIVWRAVADCVFCCTILISHIYNTQDLNASGGGSDQPGGDADAVQDCRVLSAISLFSGLAAEVYILMISVDMIISLSNPFTDYRQVLKNFNAMQHDALLTMNADFDALATCRWNVVYYHATALAVSVAAVRMYACTVGWAHVYTLPTRKRQALLLQRHGHATTYAPACCTHTCTQ